MESEKVKEIKKALECLGGGLGRKEITYYGNFNGDVLTLINELEIENKSLQDLCNKTYEDLTKEIDRLEKENTEKLKQFAERLIDKKIKLGDRFNIYDIDELLKEYEVEE